MRAVGHIAPLLPLVLAGCLTLPADDRARIFNDDGVQLFARGDYQGALESFDAALTLRPQDARLLYNLGECYDRLGDPARAEQFYTNSIEIAPDNSDARLALMASYYRTGKSALADRLIDQWLAQNPNKADPYVLDAWRLRQQKALPQAHGRLQQALALEPHNRRALTELGILYEQTGMPERALVLYERVLEREPNQADVAARLKALRAKGVQRPRPD